MKRLTNFSGTARAYARAGRTGLATLLTAIFVLLLHTNSAHAQFNCDASVPDFNIDITATWQCIDALGVTPLGQCCADSLTDEQCVSFQITMPPNNCVALLRDGEVAVGRFFVDDCLNPQMDGSNLTPTSPTAGTMNFVYCTTDDGPFDFQVCGKPCCTLDVTCPNPREGILMSCIDDVPPPVTTIAEFFAFPGAQLNDNCDVLSLTSEVIVIENSGCVDDTSFVFHIYTIKDRLDSVECTRFYRIVDEVAPGYTLPGDTLISCESDTTPAGTGMVTDTMDNCMGLVTVTRVDDITPGICPNSYVISRTWSISDECGNFTEDVQTIRVEDIAAPTFTVPADTVVECMTDTSMAVLGSVTDTMDNCGSVTLTHLDVLITTACPRQYTINRIWTAEDACMNVRIDTQMIYVVDTVAPTFTEAVDTLIACDDDTSVANLGSPTDTLDNCHFVVLSHNDYTNPLNCGGNYDLARVWIIADQCGNSVVDTQWIFVRDTVAPVFTIPSDTTVSCEAMRHPANLGILLDTSDNCSDFGVSYRDSISAIDCPHTFVINRIWEVMDDCGNRGTDIQTINVIDTTSPEMIVPDDVILPCEGDTSVVANGSPIGTDNCDIVLIVSHIDEIIPGGCPAEFDVRRIWTLEDSCGNMAVDTQMLFISCVEDIKASMEIIDIDPPSSGIKGNLNATYEIKILNTGMTKLNNIQIEDDIQAGFLGAYRGLVTGGEPQITASTADTNPTFDLSYNGNGNIDIFDGISGCIQPGQYITLQMTVEIYPGAVPGILWCPNQAIVTATGPCMLTVIDSSDTGSNPAGTNPGEFGDTGGEDDPTLLRHDCFSAWARAMACNKHTNISLGNDCSLDIPASVILEGEIPFCDMFFELMITDHHGRIVPNPVPGQYKGETLYVKVIDAVHGNSCWGTILVEDKYRPTIECVNDTVYCNALDSVPPPVFYDNCDPDPELELWREEGEFLTCDSLYTKRVVRHWFATDSCGNRSFECNQVIMLKRVPIDSVVPPKDYTLANNCALKCNGIYPTDSMGNPSPLHTGAPSIGGIPLYPHYQYCNLSATYEDRVIKHGHCVKKIFRLWKVIEWYCGSAGYREIPQIIHIIDEDAPIINCPTVKYDVTTNGGYDCEADVHLHPAFVYDSCSHDSVTVDIHYPGGILRNSNGGSIVLPFGIHQVTYRAYDLCHNSSECTVEITVKDHTPPVTICDGFTTVGLNELGEARIYAHTLDNGTYDDCYLDSFAVRRMDNGAACDLPDTLFKPFVRFCCADVDTSVMVIFRAWDKAGNYNDCMIEVEVQDKVPPLVYCPPNITVSCDYHFDMDSLHKHFGTVVQNYEDRNPIVIDDPLLDADGALFDGHVLENCQVTITESYVDSINQCRVGFIIRGFDITDGQGLTSKCYQKITIVDSDPFDSTDIVWPLHYETSVCRADFHPDSLPAGYGRPDLDDDKCSLVGMEYEDHIFNFTTDPLVCFKVLRKWKVIDWCNFQYVNGTHIYKKWTYEQIIKVSNMEPPVLTMDCEDLMECTYDPDCESGYIDLMMSATDACTDDNDLLWHYQIDLNDTGHPDTTVNGVGASIDASGEFPIGTHRILYTFEDQCGNKTTCSQLFSIVNCKIPTAYCKNGIIVDLMPIDTNGDGSADVGMIDVWANDLDEDSYHVCGNPVTFSFSPDTFNIFRRFDCDSLGMRTVRIYVTDRITGEQDFCITFVEVQDNNNACPNNIIYGNIQGRLITEDDDMISEVSIDLLGSNPMKTGVYDGDYELRNVFLHSNYEVSPRKDMGHLNGLSTRDIVLLQRHLLGREEIQGPYKLIAADVNESGSVSVRDMTEIRKLLLGAYSEFPSTDSWKFIDALQVFNDPQNPWDNNLRETYVINDMPGNMFSVDFVGFKMGDVDGSSDPSGFSGVTSRGNDPFEVDVYKSLDEFTDKAEFECFSQRNETLSGVQFTLEFDAASMRFDGIEGDGFQINEENIGLHSADQGLIVVSVDFDGDVDIKKDQLLFKLRFSEVAQTGINIQLSNKVLSSEVYNERLDILPVQLNQVDETNSDRIFVSQNNPNPFASETIIRVSSQKEREVQFSVYDVTGKVHFVRDVQLRRGWSEIKVNKDDLTTGGVYYYQIDSDGGSISKKMILMN